MHEWPIIPDLLIQADAIGALCSAAPILVTCSPLTELPAVFSDVAHPNRLHLLCPFLDAPVLPEMFRLELAASVIKSAVEQKKQVTVHCLAGRNRSGLVLGLGLLALGQTNVVATIKKAHPDALFNEVFANYLNSRDRAFQQWGAERY